MSHPRISTFGTAFIATMAFDRAARRAQQDVFLAWIATR